MRQFTNLLLSSACVMALLTGCSGKDGDPGPAGTNGSTGPQGPAGPSGQNLTGTMFGFVNPVDEYGSTLTKAGVVVTLEGVVPAVSATTNADGRYEFAGLRNGTYNLSFSRANLGTVRRLGVGHVGGDQPTFLGTNTISAPSTTTFGTVSVVNSTPNGVTLNIPFTNAGAVGGPFLRFAIFASATPNPTAANSTLLTTVSATSSPLPFSVSKITLNNAGFISGTAVYLVLYGAPSFLTSFTDPTNGRTIFNGLSATPSNQVAFVIP